MVIFGFRGWSRNNDKINIKEKLNEKQENLVSI